jgi:hypothetical protein
MRDTKEDLETQDPTPTRPSDMNLRPRSPIQSPPITPQYVSSTRRRRLLSRIRHRRRTTSNYVALLAQSLFKSQPTNQSNNASSQWQALQTPTLNLSIATRRTRTLVLGLAVVCSYLMCSLCPWVVLHHLLAIRPCFDA